MNGDDSGSTVTPGPTVPDQVAQTVYGRLGFNGACTAILSYRAPYVLLATTTRPRDPYSVVSLTTGRTVERYSEPDAAAARLAELARKRT